MPATELDTHSDAEAAPAYERTVAFFADPRAGLLLLEETVRDLIAERQIERGLVDLTTLPGIAIARALSEAGIPFHPLEYGQENHLHLGESSRDSIQAPVIAEDAAALRAQAEAPITLQVGELGAVDANLVLVPAMVDTDEKLIDLSQGTLTGAVMTQAEEAQRDLLFIDTPERGLRRRSDGAYRRAVLHIAATANDA